MNKKRILISILGIIIVFIVAMKISTKKTIQTTEAVKQNMKVSVQSVSDSKILLQKKQYPASVVGDQEIKITAKSSGTIVAAPINIGSKVNAGTLLVKIDDNGTLGTGEAGLQSLQVQQSQLAAAQAKKSYSLAKDNYDNLKKSSESTTAQKDAAKAGRDIAKLQYENSLLGLNGAVDNHLITSPIAGTITNKAVSVGDSVSIGQIIATVSKTANIKIQFYVDQNQIKNLIRGQKITSVDSNGNETVLVIRNISATADGATKKFLIEAFPEKSSAQLLTGIITTVFIETKSEPKNASNFILPLSAISIGQNESYIFIAKNDIAKKINVEIVSVDGENAEISSDIANESLVIIDGNKQIADGEKISI